MDSIEKMKVIQRLTSRVSSGLYFVQFEYLDRHDTPDLAWIRSIYILLSFHAELLLKALYIFGRDFSDMNDVDQKLRVLGHDLVKIGNEITKGTTSFGIRSIYRKGDQYFIDSDFGVYSINDFSDIRYDFIEGKVRELTGHEHEDFREQIRIMLMINKSIMDIAWEQPK
jgi:hypothetical protein